jgi:hypothetical protein
MHATVELDDMLLKTARDCSGITDLNELLREALKALIERKASRLSKEEFSI